MLREQNKTIVRFQRGADLLITAVSFIAAYFIKRKLLPDEYAGLTIGPNYYLILLVILVIWYLSLCWFEVYRPYRETPFSYYLIRIIEASLAAFMAFSLFLYMGKIHDISRLLIGIFILLNTSLLILLRWGVFQGLNRMRKKGFNTRNVLIVGSHDRAINLIKSIIAQRQSGYRILGCFDVSSDDVGKKISHQNQTIEVVGAVEDLCTYLKAHVVDELIFAMPLRWIPSADKYVVMAESMGVRVRIIPDWQLHYLTYTPEVATIRIRNFCGVPTLTLQSTPLNEGRLLIKSCMDFLLSAVALIGLFPLFLTIAVAIKAISPGPVFFSQKRLGQNGRYFNLLKFRTMVPDAEARLEALRDKNECDGPAFKINNDPRIIPWVGTFLRKSSLDELPQLINVVKREMSLVGPRPPIPSEVCEYHLWQRRRLSMKPGLTCFWQIAPKRNDLSFEEWMRLDMKYIDNWSLRLDLILIFKTAGAMLTGAGR